MYMLYGAAHSASTRKPPHPFTSCSYTSYTYYPSLATLTLPASRLFRFPTLPLLAAGQ